MRNYIETLKQRLPSVSDRAKQTGGASAKRLLYEYMIDTYGRAYDKEPGTFVAWASLAVPKQLLMAADIIPIMPEHYSPAVTAAGVAKRFLETGDSYGIPRDICSYHRLIVGAAIEKSMPPADMSITTVPACDTTCKSFETQARIAGIPFFLLDIPYRNSPAGEEYMLKQYEKMVKFIEEVTGIPYNMKKLQEIFELSRQGDEINRKILELRRAKPCPIKVKDGFRGQYMMFGALGTQKGLDYSQALYEELKAKVDAGVGAVSPEKYRLGWVHGAPYYDLDLFDWIEKELHTSIPFETNSIFLSDAPPFDPERPLESLTKRTLGVRTMGGFRGVTDMVAAEAAKFDLDGVIVFAQFGCRYFGTNAPMLRDVLQKKLGIPTLILHGDSCDIANYNAEETKGRLESFIETL